MGVSPWKLGKFSQFLEFASFRVLFLQERSMMNQAQPNPTKPNGKSWWIWQHGGTVWPRLQHCITTWTLGIVGISTKTLSPSAHGACELHLKLIKPSSTDIPPLVNYECSLVNRCAASLSCEFEDVSKKHKCSLVAPKLVYLTANNARFRLCTSCLSKFSMQLGKAISCTQSECSSSFASMWSTNSSLHRSQTNIVASAEIVPGDEHWGLARLANSHAWRAKYSAIFSPQEFRQKALQNKTILWNVKEPGIVLRPLVSPLLKLTVNLIKGKSIFPAGKTARKWFMINRRGVSKTTKTTNRVVNVSTSPSLPTGKPSTLIPQSFAPRIAPWAPWSTRESTRFAPCVETE